MKKLVLFIILVVIHISMLQAQTIPYCPSDQLQHELLQKPEFKAIEEAYEKIYRDALRHASSTTETVLMIPVVVHVMHGLGQPVGTAENISMTQIEAGIQHLNDAFANINDYSANGKEVVNGQTVDIATNDPRASVDIEIQFCLAKQDPDGNPTDGVDRIATTLTELNMDGASVGFCDDSEEGELKDLARWDTESYMNIWLVREICDNGGCGVAGYAYYPSSHGQCWDGMVVEARHFGSSTDNSKIHVHEVGHYLNLYHTFNSGCTNGDCTTDGDKVCDTPPADGTNYNYCDTPGNSCTTDADDNSANNPFNTDVDDLIADYMAYSRQSCQNTFTAIQKTRMRASLELAGAPRHGLLTSAGCTQTGDNVVYFKDDGASIMESSGTSGPAAGDCRPYIDVPVELRLYAVSGTDITVGITATNAEAMSGIDYELLDNSVTFLAGETVKTITVRIFNDNNPELLWESFILSLTGANAADFNNTMRISIQNDDMLPVATRPILYNSDMSTDAGWTFSSFNGSGTWVFENVANCLDGNQAHASNNANEYPLIFQGVDGTGYSGLQIEFDYIANVNSDDKALLVYRIPSENATFSGQYLNDQECGSGLAHISQVLGSSYDDKIFDFGFAYQTDATPSSTAFAVDNVRITADATNIASAVASGDAYLGPFTTSIFYDSNGDLLARIDNDTPHDYGCTTVEIDAAGTGATILAGTSYYYSDKTIKITPTTNKVDGTYNLTLYYTEAELAGWEAASGDSRTNISIMKTPSQMSSATDSNTNAFNTTTARWDTDHTFSATFNTGFSGFSIGNLAPAPLPVDLVNFSARKDDKQVVLTWKTLSETNFSHFVVEQSTDGQHFQQVDRLTAKGAKDQVAHYRILDKNPASGINYYRLKVVDLDGTFTYTPVVSVLFIHTGITKIFPNPVNTDGFTVIYQSDRNNTVNLRIINNLGQTVFSKEYPTNIGANELIVPVQDLPNAMYNLLLQNGTQTSAYHFWKK